MIPSESKQSFEDLVGLYHSASRRNAVVQFRLLRHHLAPDRGAVLNIRAKKILIIPTCGWLTMGLGQVHRCGVQVSDVPLAL